ncbi:DUF3892 domain-containing protein [Flavobacterium sp. SM15]|uniref:DUF3892 domain-containing protein n=1 Tax=Flavobacterium sp. SM15 TaxID=2908005 RepID=UPI001EDB477A|nr:DUF3892 domain-containing protein [Flavobacterium sp. SM15]MCG2610014.1 DUF3892 domain-containing protein [Flavobacterium sp. SM15]
MSKSSHYYISGVWKDTHGRITDVMLNEVIDDSSFKKGIKKTKAEVIQLIKNNYIVKTVVWEYPRWSIGAKVSYETVNYVEYLRTVPDLNIKNNIDNSIRMEAFF